MAASEPNRAEIDPQLNQRSVLSQESTVPGRLRDLSGLRFGRWVVIAFAGFAHKTKRSNATWKCRCDCGTEKTVRAGQLNNGTSKSCGCISKTVGGKSNLREYRIWKAMIARCHNEGNKNFYRYGGRGISVCTRWRSSLDAFIEDMGTCPSSTHSIERNDNNKNYEPGNCRWATSYDQCRNTRRTRIITFLGRSMPLIDWANELGIRYSVLWTRIARYPLEIALTVPLGELDGDRRYIPRRSVAKYPWSEWLDGSEWLLKMGVDFSCKTESMASYARQYSAKRSVRVVVSVIDDVTVKLKAIK